MPGFICMLAAATVAQGAGGCTAAWTWALLNRTQMQAITSTWACATACNTRQLHLAGLLCAAGCCWSMGDMRGVLLSINDRE